MGEWFLHQGICLMYQRHTCCFCFLDLHKVRLKGLSSHTPLLGLVTGEGEMSDTDMDLVPTFWPFACRPPSLALGFYQCWQNQSFCVQESQHVVCVATAYVQGSGWAHRILLP